MPNTTQPQSPYQRPDWMPSLFEIRYGQAQTPDSFNLMFCANSELLAQMSDEQLMASVCDNVPEGHSNIRGALYHLLKTIQHSATKPQQL